MSYGDKEVLPVVTDQAKGRGRGPQKGADALVVRVVAAVAFHLAGRRPDEC